MTYRDLGAKECAFVDKDGRLIADGALCPSASGAEAGRLQGDFHDVKFSFVRARLLRCDNGTDVEGKPLPGMCMMPHEIDQLVYEGVLYMFEQENDMRVDNTEPFLRLRQWRREFMTGVHISTDVFFTVRQVTQEAQYIFDAYLPGFKSGDSFMLLHDYQVWSTTPRPLCSRRCGAPPPALSALGGVEHHPLPSLLSRVWNTAPCPLCPRRRRTPTSTRRRRSTPPSTSASPPRW